MSRQQTTTVELVPAISYLNATEWQRVLSSGDSNVVFLTREWQQTWWDVYGRGKPLLLVVRQSHEIVAIASLFAEDGMIYFVGSGGCGSDYLDFIGDISNPETLDALLKGARSEVEDFIGFRFYLVPGRSRTGTFLREAAARLNLNFCDEGEMAAPVLDLRSSAAAEAALNKKAIRQSERFLERTGKIRMTEMRRSDEIVPHLAEFFDQHVSRWETTPFPSLFLEHRHRDFYRRLVSAASDAGWLRFTRLEWQDRAIATHFGFSYGGSYVYYKPAFAVDLARHSPGLVLLRRLILSAITAGEETFDFGIGDEAYKHRFATSVPVVRTWGLYAAGRRAD